MLGRAVEAALLDMAQNVQEFRFAQALGVRPRANAAHNGDDAGMHGRDERICHRISMVRGTADETLAKQNIPLIEGTLLRVFSAATSEQLMTFEGKEKLRKDSLEECRRVLNDLVSSPVIEQVLFTGFVMQ